MTKYIRLFEQYEAQLVVIGNGEPYFIKPFREATGYFGKLFTDPTLRTYGILNFKRSFGSLVGFNAFKKGIRSVKNGHGFGGIQGDSLQQGGAIIIGQGDIVHYFYKSKKLGDHPPVTDMLNVCKSGEI